MKFFKNSVAMLSLLAMLLVVACQSSQNWKAKADDPELMHIGIQKLTEIIKFDIFSPPVASRIYCYSTIAAYEALAVGSSDYQSLAGQVTGLTPPPQPEPGLEYCFPVAGVNAMLTVGKALVFSEQTVEKLEGEQLVQFEEMGIPDDVYQRSMDYGKQVAQHILDWSKKDTYAQTRSMPKYTITQSDPARWVPTPPSYADALEPYWMKMRLWSLDSLTQFKVPEPLPFSVEEGTPFRASAEEVLSIAKNLSEEDIATAWYWDDNPYAVEASGHLMQARKKTSPGGHWMHITSAACRLAKADLMTSSAALAIVAMSLADGFILCWQEKFRTNVIRPETYINKYIDPEFRPMIETPPFPEHPSGHATISASAASALTLLFGDNFAFVDSAEVEYGMDPRAFPSFMAAAEEAAMSRLYGGIHYRQGNTSGTSLGKEIGTYIATKIQTKKVK